MELERLAGEEMPKMQTQARFAGLSSHGIEALGEKLHTLEPILSCSIFSTAKAPKKPRSLGSSEQKKKKKKNLITTNPSPDSPIPSPPLPPRWGKGACRGSPFRPALLAIAERRFPPPANRPLPLRPRPTHTIHFGQNYPPAGRVVDEVLLSVCARRARFTREDVVEITCHGGLLPAKLVLDTVLENGARLAEPGEFTRRAFSMAALIWPRPKRWPILIHSRTELALAAASEQLAGKLSRASTFCATI